jgi:two-component system response regulator ChvI
MNLTILHAEDHPVVANAVKATLEAEGWRVVTRTDGATALAELVGPERYDLLITDNDLPGLTGLDLTFRAKALRHRGRLPVVMLTASDCEREARQAGVSVFLRKPEGVNELVPTIRLLLERGA